MAASRALRRLLRVLHLEEEQNRRTLEAALGELHSLERALQAAADQDRGGRRLIAASAQSGDLIDRIAGLEEGYTAARRAALLRPRIQESAERAAALREDYLAKRVERRQAETLVREAEAAEAAEAARRSQQSLDDWYLNRLHRSATPEKSPTATHPADVAPLGTLHDDLRETSG